ncbi:hypothetical protein ISU10_16330 [Nocardioides agariphilus]|uniref:Uncharacterized protein n=1 Tax=Nocardioides agariphilus TaxID=433664 RepID=A0A930VPB6_9ACTN|nr:hypothetical protein [Nocardioides agariphilus]MBF4769336.1 hypothetical protein [Nocardioides agariphilus]
MPDAWGHAEHVSEAILGTTEGTLDLRVKSALTVLAAGALFAVGGLGAASAAKLITGDEIAKSTITQRNLADDSVGSGELMDDSVGDGELKKNSVGQQQLADDSVGRAAGSSARYQSVRPALCMSGWPRGIRAEIRRGNVYALVSALELVVCKSVAKASKVRILHLPLTRETASDQRNR